MDIPKEIQNEVIDRNNLNGIFVLLANVINAHTLIMEKNDAIIQKLIEINNSGSKT